MSPYPLCVDLDGTLVKTDTLVEALVLLVRTKPMLTLHLPLWLLRGKAYFKHRVSQAIELKPQLLPYHEELVTFLISEHAQGRQLILATGANQKIAHAVANHMGIFAEVYASTPHINLCGKRKARELCANPQTRDGFAYAGNSPRDLPVWQQAKESIIVGASARLVAQARHTSQVVKVFQTSPHLVVNFLRAIRVHQWIKNILIFLPLIAAHQWSNPELIFRAFMAFAAFCLVSSSVYLLNDLADLEADRQHASKRLRPFAAGDLPIGVGLIAIPLLLGAGLTLSTLLAWRVVISLFAYYSLTLAYSFFLKRVVLLDVIVLALLYGCRIYTGALATSIGISAWLLSFSIFLFFSLALAKRAGEILQSRRQAHYAVPGRSYIMGDLRFIFSIGIASGYMSVLIFSLYINSESVKALYQLPQLLWPLSIVLLYWISHIWLKVHRGEMHADPLVLACKDPISYACGLVTLGIFLAARGW